MTCIQLHDPHFVMLSLLSSNEARLVQNEPARILVRELAEAKMVTWDGERARVLPDGVSALEDYRELGAEI